MTFRFYTSLEFKIHPLVKFLVKNRLSFTIDYKENVYNIYIATDKSGAESIKEFFDINYD